MNEPRRPAARFLLLALSTTLLLGACASTTDPASPSPVAVRPSPTPAPSTGPATPAPTLEPAPAPVLTSCLTLGDIDCQRAAGLARLALLPTDPPVVYVQVGPFGCRNGEARCPTTLGARPEGDVTLEFADGTGLNVHLKDEAGTVQSSRDASMGVIVEATSKAGAPSGPQPFTLGHCGVFSGIDLDGSWWDPVGPVDMDSGDAVNATEGVFTMTDPTHATFVTPTGFDLQLVRRDGPKLLPMCM
jgi:hypothetical protein